MYSTLVSLLKTGSLCLHLGSKRGGRLRPQCKLNLDFPFKHSSSFSCLILNRFNSAAPYYWNPPSPNSCFQTIVWSQLLIFILGSLHYAIISHFFPTSYLPKTKWCSFLKEPLLPFNKYLLQVCCDRAREKMVVMPPPMVSWQSRFFTHLYLYSLGFNWSWLSHDHPSPCTCKCSMVIKTYLISKCWHWVTGLYCL